MPRKSLLLILLVLFVSLFPSPGRAADPKPAATPEAAKPEAAKAETAAPAEAAPAKVETIDVGVYLNQITGVDLRNNTFSVDFWIWFRWKNSALKPMDSFEVISGKVNSKTNCTHSELPGEVHYTACRIAATVIKHWDVTRFPFDDHQLAIEIEDGDIDETKGVYRADEKNSKLDPEVSVAGWKVAGFHSATSDRKYDSNYGDTSLPADAESSYSRYTFAVDLKRTSRGRFFKVFFGLFVTALVSWCGYFIRPKDAGPRVSVAVGALFAASAITVSLNSTLPESNNITLGEKLIFFTLFMILVSLLGTVGSLVLNYAGKEAAYKKLDRTSAIIFPIVYLLGVVVSLVL